MKSERLPFRTVNLGLLALIIGVVLIGWLEESPSPKHDFDPKRDAAFADSWDDRVHITYWEKWGSFERDACQAMVDEFNRSQGQIFVHYINASQVDRKAMLAIMGGNAPDVVGLWAYNVSTFAEAGALLPLNDWMTASGLDASRYIENYLRPGIYGERIYALPTTPSSVALYYNKTHFRESAAALREAGLDPEKGPSTIEELDRFAAVLNRFDENGKPLRMGFLPTEPGWFNWSFGYYFGGRLYDEETQVVTADDPGNVRAFVWAKRYAEMYGREKMLQFRSGFGNFDSPQNAFIDGRVSMEMQGVWFSNFIRRHRPHMEFGVIPFPAAEGLAGPMSLVDCDVIAMPTGCPHPEEAWQFIRFAQTEGLAILCRQQGKHMPLKHPSENFRVGHPHLELAVFERVAASPHSFIQPRIRIWREYQHELGTAFEHVWNWRVPEASLAGLSGSSRQKKVDALCREEIEKSLRKVQERMQRRMDKGDERAKLRAEGAL